MAQGKKNKDGFIGGQILSQKEQQAYQLAQAKKNKAVKVEPEKTAE